ncbi:hypothetical protein UPYG_G00236450 [Umbra pygmaea]|uniref:Nuclear Testis protein N-terminal domain-containing protein n=1 Tax=Umbra pygmaea TaxID=75934 RepID=A0ABD0WEF8_UMBPY
MSVPEPAPQIEADVMVSATSLPQVDCNDPESMLEPEQLIFMVLKNPISTSVEPQQKEESDPALKMPAQPGTQVLSLTSVTESDLSSPTLTEPVLNLRPELDPCCRGGSEDLIFAWEPPQIEEEPDLNSFYQIDLNELVSVLNLGPNDNNGTHSENPQSTPEHPPQIESENPADETSEESIPTEAGYDSQKAGDKPKQTPSDHSVRKSQDFENTMSASAPPLTQINEESLQKWPPPPQAWYTSKGFSSLGELEKFRRWQQFRDMAKLFYPDSGADAEALACFIIPVIHSLFLQFPSLPFNQGLHLAVGKWKKLSNYDRMEYYHSAQKFIEFEKMSAEERLKVIPRFQSGKGHNGAQAEMTGYPDSRRTVKSARQKDTKSTTTKNQSKIKKHKSTKNVCGPRAPLAGRLGKVNVKVVKEHVVVRYTAMEDLLHPAGVRESLEVRGQEVDEKKKEEVVDGEDSFLSYLNDLCSQEEFVNEVEALLDLQYLSNLSSNTIDLPSEDEVEVSKDQRVMPDSKDYTTHNASEGWPTQPQTLSSTEHGAFESLVTSCDLTSERHCMSKTDSIHHRKLKTPNNHNSPVHRPPVFRQNFVTQVSQAIGYIAPTSPCPLFRSDLIQQATMQGGMFRCPSSTFCQHGNNFYDSTFQSAPLHIHTFPPVPVSKKNMNNTPTQQGLFVPFMGCSKEHLSPQTIPVCPPLPPGNSPNNGRLVFVPVGDYNPQNPSLLITMNRTTHFLFLYHPICNYTPSNQPSNESWFYPRRTCPVESNQIQQNAYITAAPNTAYEMILSQGHSSSTEPPTIMTVIDSSGHVTRHSNTIQESRAPPVLQDWPLSADTLPSTSMSGDLRTTYMAESMQQNYNQQGEKNYNSQPEANIFNTSVSSQMTQDGIKFPILPLGRGGGEKEKTSEDGEELENSRSDHLEHVKKKVLPEEVGEERTLPSIKMFTQSSSVPRVTSPPAPFPLMSNDAGRRMLTDNMPTQPFDQKDMVAHIQSAASTPLESVWVDERVCEDEGDLNWRLWSPCHFQLSPPLRETDPASVDGKEGTPGAALNQSSSVAVSCSSPRGNPFLNDHLTGWLIDTPYLAGEGDRQSPPPGVPISLTCPTEEPHTGEFNMERRLEEVPSDVGIGRVVEMTVDGGRASDLQISESLHGTDTSVSNAEMLFSDNAALVSDGNNAQASDVSVHFQASGLQSFSVDNSEKINLKSDITETVSPDNTEETGRLGARIGAADIVNANKTDATITKSSMMMDFSSGSVSDKSTEIITANQSDWSDSDHTFRPDPLATDSHVKQFDDLSPVNIINDFNIPPLILSGTESGSALQSNCTRKTVEEEYCKTEGTCIHPIVLQNVDGSMLERLAQPHSGAEEYAQLSLYPDSPGINADQLQPYRHEKRSVRSCRKDIRKTEEKKNVLKNQKVGVNTTEKKLSEPVKELQHKAENGEIHKQATFGEKRVKRKSEVGPRVNQNEEMDETLKLSPEVQVTEGKAAEKGKESSERVHRANKETEKYEDTDKEKQKLKETQKRKVDKEMRESNLKCLTMKGQGSEEKLLVNHSQGLENEKQEQHHTTITARKETLNKGNKLRAEKPGSLSEAKEKEKKQLPNSANLLNKVIEDLKPETSSSVTKHVARKMSEDAEGAPNRRRETDGGTDEQGVEVKLMAVASMPDSTTEEIEAAEIENEVTNKEAKATYPNMCTGKKAKLEKNVSVEKVYRIDAPSPMRRTKVKSKIAEKETIANMFKELCEETLKKGNEPNLKTEQRTEEAVPVKSPSNGTTGHNKPTETKGEQKDTKNTTEETERETQTRQPSLINTQRVEKDEAKITCPEKHVIPMTRSVTSAREKAKVLERNKKTKQEVRETPGIELQERIEMPHPATRGKLKASVTNEYIASLSRRGRNKERERENVIGERKEDEKEGGKVKPTSETWVTMKTTSSEGDKNEKGKNGAKEGNIESLVYKLDHEMATMSSNTEVKKNLDRGLKGTRRVQGAEQPDTRGGQEGSTGVEYSKDSHDETQTSSPMKRLKRGGAERPKRHSKRK